MTADVDGAITEFHCTPLNPDDLPEWYDKMLTKNLETMKKVEFEI